MVYQVCCYDLWISPGDVSGLEFFLSHSKLGCRYGSPVAIAACPGHPPPLCQLLSSLPSHSPSIAVLVPFFPLLLPPSSSSTVQHFPHPPSAHHTTWAWFPSASHQAYQPSKLIGSFRSSICPSSSYLR